MVAHMPTPEGALIRQVRQARGESLVAFARRVGLGHRYLSAIERGQRPDVRLGDMIVIADGLEYPVEVLIASDAA